MTDPIHERETSPRQRDRKARSPRNRGRIPGWVWIIVGVVLGAITIYGILQIPGILPGTESVSLAQPTRTRQPTEPPIELPSTVETFLTNINPSWQWECDDVEPFDSHWWVDGEASITDGLLHIDAFSYLGIQDPISISNALLFQFRFEAGSELVFGLSRGESPEPDYRAVALNETWSVWMDEVDRMIESDLGFTGNFYPPEPDSWHYLLVAVERGPVFHFIIWDQDNPTHAGHAVVDTTLEPWGLTQDWDFREWHPWLGVEAGSMDLDSVAGLTFDEATNRLVPTWFGSTWTIQLEPCQSTLTLYSGVDKVLGSFENCYGDRIDIEGERWEGNVLSGEWRMGTIMSGRFAWQLVFNMVNYDMFAGHWTGPGFDSEFCGWRNEAPKPFPCYWP